MRKWGQRAGTPPPLVVEGRNEPKPEHKAESAAHQSPLQVNPNVPTNVDKIPPVVPNLEAPPSVVPNVEQSIARLAQLVTTVVQNRTHAHHGIENTIDRVLNLGAENFDGSGDPIEAESWLIQVERIFEVMGCTDDQRLLFSTFLLKGKAHQWWMSIQLRYSDPLEITWARFRQEFYDRYFPNVYRDAKRSEFYRLVQGSMTVEEYVNKFIELSRFAPLVAQDEREKCERFEEGLHRRIRTVVVGAMHTEFGKLVEAAMRVEKILMETQRKKRPRQQLGSQYIEGPSNRMARKDRCFISYSEEQQLSQSPDFQRGQWQIMRQLSVNSSVMSQGPHGRGQQNSGTCPQCGTCGRHHFGQCRIGIPGCYHCGQEGHIKRDCPALTQSGNFVQRTVFRGFSEW